MERIRYVVRLTCGRWTLGREDRLFAVYDSKETAIARAQQLVTGRSDADVVVIDEAQLAPH